MNKIIITNQVEVKNSQNEEDYVINYQSANKMLPILRSEHFKLITIRNSSDVNIKNLRFLIQLSRILNQKGKVVLDGSINNEVGKLLVCLGLFQGVNQGNINEFYLKQVDSNEGQKRKELPIGFHSNQQQEEIDENELLKNQNLNLTKDKIQNCDTKPRACANCSCGRKDAENKVPSKEELVKAINEGKQVSGCGKCSLGDSFRCGSCPYKGLPAFKLGDKLNLDEQGTVVVQSGKTFVSSAGKVKIQL